MDFTRSEVLQKLEEKLAKIHLALTDLTDIQTQLRRNASEAKNDIQATFGRQLASLRTREVYLLTQVDTLLQIKQERLHLQAEGLKQELGALETLLDQTKAVRKGFSLKEIEDIMKRFRELDLHPEEDAALGFGGDAEQLKKAILSYGGINPKRPRLARSGQIMRPFEQFASNQVWLCNKSTNVMEEDGPFMVYPVFLEKGDPAAWLVNDPKDCFAATTAKSTYSESEGGDGDSFVLIPENPGSSSRNLDACSAHFANILNSPNIMWIRSTPKKDDDVGMSRHQAKQYSYYCPSRNMKDWLRKPAGSVQEEEDQVMDMQATFAAATAPGCGHSQTPVKSVEIEDLANLVCVQEPASKAPNPCSPKTKPAPRQQRKDKNTPCCSSSPPKTTLPNTTAPTLSDACKGNEQCKSFEECLCEENCATSPRRDHTFTGVPESSKNQWLIVKKPAAAGEKIDETMEVEDDQPMATEEELPKEELPKADLVKDWLASKTNPTTTNYESSIVSSFLKWQLEENRSWLKKDDDDDTTRPVEQQAVNRTTVNEWLVKKMEAQDIDDNRKHQEAASQWLVPSAPSSLGPAPVKATSYDSSAWLAKGRDSGMSSAESDPKPGDGLQEKWLLKKAFGMSAPTPKPALFSYFNSPMDVDQWLKK